MLRSTVLAVALLLVPAAHAEDIFIPQVATAAPVARALSLDPPDYSGKAADLQLDLATMREPGRNAGAIVQSGFLNAATQDVSGIGNAVIQHQNGTSLTSDVLVAGRDNGVAVDQEGTGFASDVIVAGENKLLIHIQRDAAPAVAAMPILLQGSAEERLLVVDTPYGRLTKPLD